MSAALSRMWVINVFSSERFSLSSSSRECSEPLFDVLCFILRADESQGEIVGIAYILESPIVGVLGSIEGSFWSLFFASLGSLLLSFFVQFVGGLIRRFVFLISFPLSFPRCIAGMRFCLYKPVQLREQDIGKDRADY